MTFSTASVDTNGKGGQKTYLTNLWGTIKGNDGRAKTQAENEALNCNGTLLTKQLATKFN